MKISELEKKLAKIREKKGDLEVGIILNEEKFIQIILEFTVDAVKVPNSQSKQLMCALLNGDYFDDSKPELKIIK